MTELKTQTAVDATTDDKPLPSFRVGDVIPLGLDTTGSNDIREIFTEEVLKTANDLVSKMSTQEVILWALSTFKESLALSSSFGIQSSVMLHLVSTLSSSPTFPIIWIDTGYLPKETYQYVDTLVKELGINVHTYQSPLSPARMEALHGELWKTSHEAYAYLRKVEPMNRALKELKIRAQLVGLRSEQTTHRKNMQMISVTSEGILKICPILHWSNKDVQTYIDDHNLPRHPLEAQGYVTVGDAHSSRPLASNDKQNERATRFNGKFEECGLHIELDKNIVSRDLKIPTTKYG